MRSTPLILTGSLGLNLLLAAFCWSQPRSSQPKLMRSTNPITTPTTIFADPTLAPAPASVPGKTQSTLKTRTLWERLQTDNLDGLAARLQAAGFPKSEQAAMIISLIREQTSRELRRILGPIENQPYWDTLRRPIPPKDISQLLKTFADGDRLIRQYLINTDLYAANEEYVELEHQQFGPFSTEKLRGLRTIENDFREMKMKLRADREQRPGAARSNNDADKARDRLLEQEKLADIKQLLTPEEYAQYELRASPTAALLRNRLELLQPTETEFLTLFPLQKAYDEKMKDDTLSEAAKKAAREQLNAQVTAALGPQRGADAQVALQGENNKLARLLIRLDLPIATVNTVNAVRDDLINRGNSIRADAQLTATQRDTQLTALVQEAATKLTTTLGGERGFNAYSDLKGDWIRALQPNQ